MTVAQSLSNTRTSTWSAVSCDFNLMMMMMMKVAQSL